MNSSFDKRSKEIKIKQRVYGETEDILRGNLELHRHAIQESKITVARTHYAASRIQGIIRGFLDRLLCKDLRRERKSAIMIQKAIRGKLGKLKAQRQYYYNMSVVKSDHALKDIIDRSTIVREVDGGKRHYWIEYFDPVSDSFWYYNKKNGRNMWQCPQPFQSELVCTWNGGYDAISNNKLYMEKVFTAAKKKGDEKLDKIQLDNSHNPNCCRKVFGDVLSYQNHLRTAHKWFCPACDHKNVGASFPKCQLCGNSRHDVAGHDMEKQFEHDVQQVHNKLYAFMLKDRAADDETYDLKERLVSVALRRRGQRLEMEWKRQLNKEAEDAAAKEVIEKGMLPKDAVVSMVDSQTALQNYSPPHSNSNSPGKSTSTATLPPIHKQKGSSKVDLTDTKRNDSRNLENPKIAVPCKPKKKIVDPLMGDHAPPKMVFTIDENGEIHSEIVVQDMFAPSTGDNSDSKNGVFKPGLGLYVKPLNPEERRKKQMDILRKVFNKKVTSIPSVPFQFSSISAAASFKNDLQISEEEQFLNAKFGDALLQGDISGNEFNVIVEHSANDTTYYSESGGVVNAETGDVGPSDSEVKDLYDSEDDIQKLIKETGFMGPGDLQKAPGSPNTALTNDSNSLTSFSLWNTAETQDKMLVCMKYLQTPCQCKQMTTCPLAHPGIRDSAILGYTRLPGRTKKVPYVRVCKKWLKANREQMGKPDDENTGVVPVLCPDGTDCKQYHVYIRPSTADIIRKLYPMEEGVVIRVLASGSTYDGNVKHKKFHGYGVYTWTGKKHATYLGDWVHGVRTGVGIYRDRTGAEYVGQWKDNLRHGEGVLTLPNGEEYVGGWENGKMHGIGRLTSKNGDIYEGQFKNHKYDGIGLFVEGSTGNTYLGNFSANKAQGMGILSLASRGEKYKGMFDQNHRHGKGVCSYKNGSKYAGSWYRGLPSGFGIYLGPASTIAEHSVNEMVPPKRVDKYVGEWDGGQKHGVGRYMFSNGDFYDGDFRHNKARGTGIYYHSNGNIYKGSWCDNKRQGRGHYMFANGSTFVGNWENNKICGKGKFDFANNCFYRGEFQDNHKHGKGIYTWANGNCYKGNFVFDVMSGTGELAYFEGHRYIGQWENNKKNGFGVFAYAKGHKYEGMWKDDMRHGSGKMTFFVGSFLEEQYDGEWANDERHGKGCYVYRKDEGCVYEGMWRAGRRHGHGKLSFKDGSYYRGDFKEDQMWGKGIYVDASDGTQYDGEWYKNMRQGTGTLIDSIGSIYNGDFWANMKHGYGKLHNIDGSVYEGRWEGNLIKGRGAVNIPVGEGPLGGPTEINVKVFGH